MIQETRPFSSSNTIVTKQFTKFAEIELTIESFNRLRHYGALFEVEQEPTCLNRIANVLVLIEPLPNNQRQSSRSQTIKNNDCIVQ